MKALAIGLWLLVLCGGLLVFQQKERTDIERHSNVSPALLVIAHDMPVNKTEPVVMPVLLGMKLCARLGVFPSREWAERVAGILARGDVLALPSEMEWVIDKVAVNKYFIRFERWTLDELAERMTHERAKLKKLIAITAIPEQC